MAFQGRTHGDPHQARDEVPGWTGPLHRGPQASCPTIFILAFGLGLAFPPLTVATVQGLKQKRRRRRAAARASQQTSAAIGLALLSAVPTSTVDSRLAGAAAALGQAGSRGDTLADRAAQALTHGDTRPVMLEVGLLLLAAIASALAFGARREQRRKRNVSSTSAL